MTFAGTSANGQDAPIAAIRVQRRSWAKSEAADCKPGSHSTRPISPSGVLTYRSNPHNEPAPEHVGTCHRRRPEPARVKAAGGPHASRSLAVIGFSAGH